MKIIIQCELAPRIVQQRRRAHFLRGFFFFPFLLPGNETMIEEAVVVVSRLLSVLNTQFVDVDDEQDEVRFNG